mgnify:CR=1 FL=1
MNKKIVFVSGDFNVIHTGHIRLLNFAKSEQIDLTIVGPEDPLVNGITNRFEEMNLMCFGPTKEAAQLEGSKEFMKIFLEKYSIPTAQYESFTNEKEALDFIEKKGCPIVIKADGLAAGKGVTIANTLDEAKETIHELMNSQIFGDAGKKVVIEECLFGEEASFIVMTDGKTAIPFASSQDHKARDDGDKGPNTGGMGAYSPAPIVDKEIHDKIMNEVIYPTLQGLEKEGLKYIGFLYAGMMIDSSNNLKVLEFNCRLGDPETQCLMMQMESDLLDAILQALNGEEPKITWKAGATMGVVIASGGYPNSYKNEVPINISNIKNAKLFHAGTKSINDKLVTNGGRVFSLNYSSDSIDDCKRYIYDNIEKINFDNMTFRRDIGEIYES